MRQGKVTINRERCKACYLCAESCPFKVLEPDTAMNSSGVYPVKFAKAEKCTACASCYRMCPDTVLTVYELEAGDAERGEK